MGSSKVIFIILSKYNTIYNTIISTYINMHTNSITIKFIWRVEHGIQFWKEYHILIIIIIIIIKFPLFLLF